MNIALSIVLFIAAIFLIVAVLLQSGKDNKLSGAITGGSGDTYLGKSKSSSLDKKLNILTIIVGVIVAILLIVNYVSQDDTDLDALQEQADAAATTAVVTETVAPSETAADTQA